MNGYPDLPKNLIGIVPTKELLNLMPRELVQEFRAFIFDKNPKIKIGAVNPDNKVLQNYAKEKFGDNVAWFCATDKDVALILKNYSHDFQNEVSQLASNALEKNNNVTKIVDNIIHYAFNKKASDIHIEPVRNKTMVRFRIDGRLHNIFELPKKIHQALIARFKILGNLKIDEYRRPQDGRIEPEAFPNTSLRISTIPTLFGEKVALRVLDELNKNLSLESLGLSKEQQEVVLENIEKPFGMIVASGPTGSGKTTTLYGLLKLLKKEGLNISTLEDPIEYVLPGVNQTQTNQRVKLNFASGLRSLLRQDPDVIMVGEIRDSETANMAANAAMTGHLVLTTIHTNDAPSSFVRFLEMKVEDFVISSTINLVIAQRLVRRVCTHCATQKKLNPVIIEKIKERKDIMKVLKKRKKGRLKNLTFLKGKGCKECFQTGFLGRIGIFELLAPNKEIHDLVLKHESASRIRKAAEKKGFKDMIEDGIDKIFEGKTTFEEVLRTTKKET